MLEIIETEIGFIPKHWKIVPFNKALKVKGRVGWKGYKTSDLRNEGPVVVGGTNIKANLYLDFSQTTYLSREKFEESPEIMLKKDDVILVTRGNGIGDVGYYNGQFPEATINPSLVILSQFIGNPKYLFYYLNSPQGRFQVLSIEGGTSIPALYQGYINTLLCPIPPKHEQEFIVEVLSSIDEKIDLLHRQNKTLEQLAESLFKRMFYRNEWTGSLSEFIKVRGGYAFKSKDFKVTGFASIIKITNISMGFVDIKKSDFVEEIIVKNLDKRFKIKGGDFLIAMTGAEIGKIGIVETSEKELWVNQRVGKIEAKVPFGDIIGYLALKSREGQDHIINTCSGSAQENISTNGIEEMIFASYDSEEANSFGKQVEPLFDKISFNFNQISTLSQVRDTLLPKLMSGEVRIKM